MSENPYASPPDGDHGEEYIPEITSEARNWAVFCHLAAYLGFGGPGFGHILGPLVLWLLKRNDHPFIDENGKESLNFQISISIYTVLLLPTLCVIIGIPLLISLAAADVILVAVAAIKASNGEVYRYPMSIRLIK